MGVSRLSLWTIERDVVVCCSSQKQAAIPKGFPEMQIGSLCFPSHMQIDGCSNERWKQD